MKAFIKKMRTLIAMKQREEYYKQRASEPKVPTDQEIMDDIINNPENKG